jgi:serine/threonine-protein phosphatase 2B catalytic subunit
VIPEIDFTQHVQDDGTTVSTVERVVKDVQAPAFHKPTDEQFFSREDPTKPDIAFLKNHFYREGRLTDDQGELRFYKDGVEVSKQQRFQAGLLLSC